MKKLFMVMLVLSAPLSAAAQEPDPEAGEVGGTGWEGGFEGDAEAEGEAGTTPAAAPAQAQPAAPSEAPTSQPAPEGDGEWDELSTKYPNKKYIDAVLERSKHMSLGYALGRMGDGFVFGLRLDQPVTKTNWAYLQWFHYTNFGPFKKPFDPVLLLGVNFIVRTKLVFGIFRLYGGGGFFAGYRPSPSCRNPFDQSDIARAYVDQGLNPSLLPPDPNSTNPAVQRVAARLEDIRDLCKEQKDSFSISGGGTGGIEFFASPLRAYFIEISGGGGVQKNGIWTDSGLVLRAGNQFYF